MPGILIAGTSSDAGKSLVVTALCRALRRRGLDVAPFKAQNMSNNSMVCSDGTEIGRAQYLQAQAAGVEASSLMNPVLLKPSTDRTSFVVVRGKPFGVLRAGEYAHERPVLAHAAWEAYRALEAQHQLIVCEGAGSVAEINLRRGDYTNLGLAAAVGLPIVIVGDIDRGGVLASLYGSWALLGDDDRARLSGYIINKFRGDVGILRPGLDEITRRTGMPCLGVLPWLADAWLDGEDSLELGRWRHDATTTHGDDLRVAVVRFPRISNATDVDALAHEPGVDVVVTDDPGLCRGADVLVLPGSRSTVADLQWLRRTGIADAVAARHTTGLPTLAVCGGYQMLGHRIADDGVEAGSGTVAGLGLLPHDVEFRAAKILGRPSAAWRGHPVAGYEIHHGVCTRNGATAAEPFLDGSRVGETYGTMWHGALECDAFRRAWLTAAAEASGSPWRPSPDAAGFGARREAMIERAADAVAEHLDVDRLLALAHKRSPR